MDGQGDQITNYNKVVVAGEHVVMTQPQIDQGKQLLTDDEEV